MLLHSLPADAGAALERVADWLREQPTVLGRPPAVLPHPVRTVLLLYDVHVAVASAGMGAVLDWAVGDHFAHLAAFADAHEMPATARYLDDARLRFPSGIIPADRGERQRLLGALDHAGVAFDDLDRASREAVLAELSARTIAYIHSHWSEIERAIAPSASIEDEPILLDPEPLERLPGALSRYLDIVDHGLPSIERLPPEVVRIGDVIEYTTKQGLVYAQASHEHPFWRLEGPVIRVLPGPHALRPENLDELVAGETCFFGIGEVNQDIADDRAVVVANRPIPAHAAAFPTFRYYVGQTASGRTLWRLWRGGVSGEPQLLREPLPDEIRTLPPRNLLGATSLGVRLRRGWRPGHDLAPAGAPSA